jgi:hypothetical protein
MFRVANSWLCQGGDLGYDEERIPVGLRFRHEGQELGMCGTACSLTTDVMFSGTLHGVPDLSMRFTLSICYKRLLSI